MLNKEVQIEVPTAILENWQEIVNILADMIPIPASFVPPMVKVHSTPQLRSCVYATPLNIRQMRQEKEDKMSQELMDYFNKQPRLMTLSTADKGGNVNSAYFGSPQMTDPKTIVMGSGTNRTLANLKENPRACFTVLEPGPSAPEWKGVRLYAKMSECAESGKKLDDIRALIGQKVGAETAKKNDTCSPHI